MALVLGAGSLSAVQPKDSPSSLESKEMFVPELYISNQNLALDQALAEASDRGALKLLAARRAGAEAAGREVKVWIDPRGGAAVNVLGSFPLIPGDGAGNRVTLEQVGAALGRGVSRVDGGVVADLVRRFAEGHRSLLGIDTAQLGEARTGDPSPDLWHVSIPQVYQGIPVRYGRLLATLSHGNMVLLGAENWADVQGLSVSPSIAAGKAVDLGFEYAGGRSGLDDLLSEARLEIVPYAPQELQSGEGYGGPVGQGLRHYLAWVYTYQRRGEDPVYKVTVDAHSGRVLEFKDTNEYVTSSITGGVYPLTNTGVCPTPQTCGAMQLNEPMPFVDTGLAAPENFTSSAGTFNYTSGTVTTTFNGKYVRTTDTCGTMTQSTVSPPLLLGGANNDHDCTVPAGSSAGNTAASRSGIYELSKLIEMARGYLPTNTWLQGQLTANMNINITCNAFWNGTSVNFYRSGGGCRNTGEIAAVFDHEWGHGMDDNDTAGALSSSSEAYADIASIYRLQASCVGHGFFQTVNPGCGMTADGTGFNQDEDQTAGLHCDLDCSGVRDADWDRHADHTPDTPLGFVCTACNSGSGPCARQVHCSAAPVRQAAWDFVKRDLQAAPFSLDDQTAFLVGNKLFYQGSGNVGAWHSCTCGGTADGCAAANGYMQWLAADDDNGNLGDGTPHMTALYAAFNRHGIACATPTPVNSGCAAGPTAAATLVATGGAGQVGLAWGAVPNAERYWVYRSEGYAGCNFGKALVADVNTTSYTDTQVANGRSYYYSVVAVDGATAGVGKACFGPASNCANAMPTAGPEFAVSCGAVGGVVPGTSGGTTCSVSSVNGYAGSVGLSCPGAPAGVTCGFVPPSVGVVAAGSANSSLTVNVAASVPDGAVNLSVQGTDGSVTRLGSTTVNVQSFSVSCANVGLIVPGGMAASTCTVSSPGAFGGTVNLACDTPPAGLACAFSPAAVTVAAGGNATATLTLTASGTTPTGMANLTTSGTSGAIVRSGGFTANVQDYGTARSSKFDPALGSPRCFAVGSMCESGSLVNGRAAISGGVEPNQPNTLGGACADGGTGSYHVDESLDWLAIRTDDGSALMPGKAVTIEARVWVADAAQDRLDLYFTDNLASPSWTLIGTVTPAGNGLRTLTQSYTLPGNPANFRVAIRGNFRRGGTAGACTAGARDDRDDLAFGLVPVAQATWDAGEQAPRCTGAIAGCDSGTLLVGRGTMAPAEVNQPNTIDDSCADGASGTFHSDESNDRIRVFTNDGTTLATGKQVTVEATVWAWTTTTSDWLELYHTADATAATPVWTQILTATNPPGSGQRVMSTTFTLPAGANQAVRARFRFGTTGPNVACGAGNYNDHDDLIFPVAP